VSAYVIVSYDVTDPQAFEGYVPGVMPLLEKHGAEVVVADFEPQQLEGEKRGVRVVLKFESEEAARRWYEDPDYAPVRQIRHDACANNELTIVKPFAPPAP
jgi:uncharacterized protein (DUF1330 family)